MVEIVVIDGETAVTGLAHGAGHVRGVDRDGQADHVDAWRHHFAHRRVAQIV